AHGQEFRQQAHDELVAELGREPTAEEIEARHDEILNDAVEKGAEKRFRKERERFLKFDLEPFEFADLQSKKLLVLEFEGLQIIHMRKSAGGAVYYRDRPDPIKATTCSSFRTTNPSRLCALDEAEAVFNVCSHRLTMPKVPGFNH